MRRARLRVRLGVRLGLGLAIKMDDGNTARAAEVVLAGLLHTLMKAEGGDAALLRSVWDAPLRNWNGIEVGRLRVAAGPGGGRQTG